MFKRLAAAASVSVIAVVGLAPAASAASHGSWHQPKPSITKIIDWDAPKPAPGGPTTQAIDWD